MDDNIPPRMWKKLILIQGHRRSGSTWLAAVLGEAEEASLIPYEPLWLKHHPDSEIGDRIAQMRRKSGWYIDFNHDNEDNVTFARLIREHLAALVEHYFGGPVGTLLIKEPHPNWMPILKAAFQPDHVLFLDRHPLGILNSYEKSALYEGWETEDEWQKFLIDMQKIAPDRLSDMGRIAHPAKRVVYMAYIGRQLCLEGVKDIPHTVVQYEPLCLDPYNEFAHIFRNLGWHWDETIRARVKPLVDPDGENEPGFVAVHKRSKERAYAWRKEMAPHLVRAITCFLEKIGWEINLPDEVEPLTLAEKLRRIKIYIRRRYYWLRRFGVKAVLRSR
ncbi:MAG: sulfotransferase [Anaerolineales bacterium]|nr:sulfotransferase [Anaerolineales bacterium]